NRYRRWHVAGEHFDPLLQPFEETRAWIVSREDSSRRHDVVERIDNRWRQLFHALRERLDDEVFTVTIDDERGQQVCLAVDQSKPLWSDVEGRSKANRGFEPVPNQRRIGRHFSVGQHPDRDLRSIAVESGAKNLASAIPDGNDVPWIGPSLGDVRA